MSCPSCQVSVPCRRDEEKPVCRKCRTAKRECRRGPGVAFRYGLSASEDAEGDAAGDTGSAFSDTQPWVAVPKELTFRDETDGVQSGYITPIRTPESLPKQVSPSGHVAQTLSCAGQRPRQDASVLPHAVVDDGRDATPRVLTVGPAKPVEESSRSIPISRLLSNDALSAPTIPYHGLENVHCGPMKIRDRNQASLMRHYTENLACWLDVCDVSRTFETVIPELAIRNAIVLNALLAFSARHLSRVADFDPIVADIYHEESVELLIPRLNDDLQSGKDETLLVATIFLRLYEQMNAQAAAVDFQQHLSGSSAFVNAQVHRGLVRASEVMGSFLGRLHEASFWSFLRQDIDMALTNQKPPKVDLSVCRITWDADASDCTWAKWMIWIVAETAALCFGDGKSITAGKATSEDAALRERWGEIKAKCTRWWWSKPSGFLPLHYQGRNVNEGRWFPEIWLSSPWHITGIQYYHAAMVLLAVYDPFRLQPGREYMRRHRELQNEVLHHAREMVGVCFGKKDDVPARLTLTHAIIACGSWFEEEIEQDLLLKLLRDHTEINGWPTYNVVASLLRDWGRNA